jgi:hypothetical protein
MATNGIDRLAWFDPSIVPVLAQMRRFHWRHIVPLM